jgi:hypothetical protein
MTTPGMTHDIDQVRTVETAYMNTQQRLANIQARFDAAVSGVSGVQSSATMAMKSAVATEVVPRFNAIVQQFAGLGEGIGMANRDAANANNNATDSVNNFRSKLR